MATHTLPSGSIAQTFALPETDLMAIIEKAAPGQNGLSILYSLAGSIEMRIARLAAMTVNIMASAYREENSIDKYNDAMSAILEHEARDWAFKAAGLTNKDMISDLRDLIAFRLTVTDKIQHLTTKRAQARWLETIERASTPQAVEDWKLEFSWQEYVESCHGKTEMTEDEFKKIESVNLSGEKKNWADYAVQIIDLIDTLTTTETDFNDLAPAMQKRLLESISSEDKEVRFRTSALKLAKNPADLHARRQLISSFCADARRALTHPKYQESHAEPEVTDESQAAAADRSNARRQAKLTPAEEARENMDALEDLVSDEV